VLYSGEGAEILYKCSLHVLGRYRMTVCLFVMLIIVVSIMHLTLLRHDTFSQTSARSPFGANKTEHNLVKYTTVNLAEHEEVTVDVNKMLFIHVPKCGGTAFTSLLRKIQCHRNSTAHPDCCRNPGSCYIKGFRRCISILGCVSHFPRRYVDLHLVSMGCTSTAEYLKHDVIQFLGLCLRA